jgi:hypothetical protein
MASNKRTQAAIREDFEESQETTTRHQPAVSNSLKIKLDHLKTFEALTENQQKFFDAYKRGDYFIGMFGSPGVGKCQGEDVEVNLIVSDELYDKLIKI